MFVNEDNNFKIKIRLNYIFFVRPHMLHSAITMKYRIKFEMLPMKMFLFKFFLSECSGR